jgi:cell division inhibitor SulA/protein ImuA
LTWAGKRVVWLAPPYLPYAPALAAAGVNLEHLAVVSAPGRRDALWAAEQALRGGCCHALLGWFRKAAYDDLRRLAVAAEASSAWVALFRPLAAAAESSPACLRLVLEPDGDALAVKILKRRGAPLARALRLPVKRPVHALGRTPFPVPAAGSARADRGLGLPVHA